MGNHCVWYSVYHDKVPHLANPMVFASGLSQDAANKVADSVAQELGYVLGKEFRVMSWVE